MSDGNFLELKKQTLDNQFKTQQMQENVQEQKNTFAENAPVPTVKQKDRSNRARTVKRKSVLGKNKEVEEVYGVTKEDMEDTYARERKEAFQEHLAQMSADHLKMAYNEEYTNILQKIQEYVRIPMTRETARLRGETLMGIRELIKQYILNKTGQEDPKQEEVEQLNLSAEEKEPLEIMRMYQLYFTTFNDGNLKVPKNGKVKNVTGKNEPALMNWNKYAVFGEYRDASKELLFPSEPSIEDVKQGMIADCYLMAALVSIVQSDPMAIKKSMHDNGKTVTVRFYEPVENKENPAVQKMKPVYVTVNKTVPRYKARDYDIYAKGGLWVAMIEKAYAAWGKHPNENIARLKEKAMNRYMDQGFFENAMELAEAEVNQYLEASNGSYATMGNGGTAEDFIQMFTGKEAERRYYTRQNTEDGAKGIIKQRAVAAAKSEVNLLSVGGNLMTGLSDFTEPYERFKKRYGEDAAKELLKMTDPSSEEINTNSFSIDFMKIYASSLEALPELVIKKFYEVDVDKATRGVDGSNKKKIRQTKMMYLEDVQNILKEEIDKSWAAVKNKNPNEQEMLNKFLEKYDSVFKNILEHMMLRMEELQDESLEIDEKERRIQLQHRSESGKYTKFAIEEYEYIQEVLKEGGNITYGIHQFSKKEGFLMAGGPVEKEGISEGHAYSVIGTEEMDGKKFIKLRNPWAGGTMQYSRTKGPDGKERIHRNRNESEDTDGIFFVELNEFIAKGESITVNRKKLEILKDDE